MGNRRPDRRRREAGAAHRVVQHADDAGRSLVARPLHAEARREHFVGRGAGALDRAGVRSVAEQRAERDDHLAVRRAGDADDVVAERTPAQVRFDAEQQHEVAAAAGQRSGRERERRPVDRAHDTVDELDRRTRGLEVEVLLDVERGERPGVARRARASAPRRRRRRPRRSSPRTPRSSRVGATTARRSSGRSRVHLRSRSARSLSRRTTGLRSVPTPSMVISTTSPSTSQRGGVRAGADARPACR